MSAEPIDHTTATTPAEQLVLKVLDHHHDLVASGQRVDSPHARNIVAVRIVQVLRAQGFIPARADR